MYMTPSMPPLAVMLALLDLVLSLLQDLEGLEQANEVDLGVAADVDEMEDGTRRSLLSKSNSIADNMNPGFGSCSSAGKKPSMG